MKHRPRPPEQDDLLRPRLVDLIDMRHELVKLAAPIAMPTIGTDAMPTANATDVSMNSSRAPMPLFI